MLQYEASDSRISSVGPDEGWDSRSRSSSRGCRRGVGDGSVSARLQFACGQLAKIRSTRLHKRAVGVKAARIAVAGEQRVLAGLLGGVVARIDHVKIGGDSRSIFCKTS